jgi:hypothetical protein
LQKLQESCDEMLDALLPTGAHELLCAAGFAERHPDPSRAAILMQRIADALPGAEFYIAEPPVEAYGLTPLHFAPNPKSAFRRYFNDATIAGHLDDLGSRQLEDGGWPITWEPPGPAAECEWRARLTLDALSTLTRYQRVSSLD